MKLAALAATAVFALPLLADPAIAGRRYRSYESYDRGMAYPHASERQRRNSLAYDNGGYYENIQSAHAFGSRSWWALRRGGSR